MSDRFTDDDEDEQPDTPAGETDEVYEDDSPWQAEYAWLIVTQQVDVPPPVHAAAVAWWVAMLATNEES